MRTPLQPRIGQGCKMLLCPIGSFGQAVLSISFRDVHCDGLTTWFLVLSSVSFLLGNPPFFLLLPFFVSSISIPEHLHPKGDLQCPVANAAAVNQASKQTDCYLLALDDLRTSDDRQLSLTTNRDSNCSSTTGRDRYSSIQRDRRRIPESRPGRPHPVRTPTNRDHDERLREKRPR